MTPPLKKFLIASLFGILATPLAFCAASVSDLRCENLANPEGVDSNQPRLSWMLHSSDRNQMQSAYEVLVASSAKRLDAGAGDLWDSGKISSDQSIQIPYAGKTLASRADCFWKVRVWDQDGKVSSWSEPAHWTMGLLSKADWGNAKWIGLDGKDDTKSLENTSWIWSPGGDPEKSAAPATNYFRRVVTIPAGRTITSARFQYTGDNEGRGWINEFDLGARNSPRTVKFNDITTRLEPGQTYVFGLTGYHNKGGEPAGVVGSLEIEFSEGPPLIIPTDEHWKVSDHEVTGWLKTDFDDSSWTA